MTGTVPPPQHPDLSEGTPLDGLPGGADAEPEEEAVRGAGLPEGFEPVLAVTDRGTSRIQPSTGAAREEGNAS